MSDWLEALRVASESTAIDLVTAGALDEFRHALVVGRLIDRETIDRKAHEVMLQRFTGYLLQGNTIGTSIDEISVLSREMLDAAIGGSDEK